MRGEVRSAAVNILNPTDRPLDCRVSVEGLPDGTDIELSEVLYTDTAWFRSISGALKAGKGNAVAFTLPAGISKQVWIKSVRPTGAAGLRTGVVRARLSDGTELTRPLTVNVYDLDYPREPRLQVGGWDYLNNPNYYRNPGATESKVALHRDMGVNVEWATGGVRPTGRGDAREAERGDPREHPGLRVPVDAGGAARRREGPEGRPARAGQLSDGRPGLGQSGADGREAEPHGRRVRGDPAGTVERRGQEEASGDRRPARAASSRSAAFADITRPTARNGRSRPRRIPGSPTSCT